MEYRVIETALHTRKSLIGRLLIFLFGSVTPRFQINPLQFELETILNQMARQGYWLISQQIKAGSKGRSETLLLIFAKRAVNENLVNSHKAPDDINWSELETRYVTD